MIIFIGGILAQTGQEPFSGDKFDKIYYIKSTSEPPKIDGILDDPIWSSINPITDFVQEYPDNMEEPTEKTEVYLTYDDQAIYVAAHLYDSEPSKIARQLAPQDDWYGAFDEMADWFSIDIDSQHDHQTGFSFAVNASGVISDEMIFHDSEYDSDWNAIWHAEVNINEKGWSLEIEIPFSNLSFYDVDEQVWGLNITRFIQRKYETVSWVAFPFDVEGVVSKYGHLHGLQGIFPPAKFKFVPYILGGATQYSDIRLKHIWEPWSHNLHYSTMYKKNIGLDMIYNINPSSQIMLTINLFILI